MEFRNPSPEELSLLRALAKRSSELNLPPDWISRLRVATMSDGGMGSLRLCLTWPECPDRQFGSVVAEIQFTDADGVEVIASLHSDKDGHLYELDMWKTDFSSLVCVPTDWE